MVCNALSVLKPSPRVNRNIVPVSAHQVNYPDAGFWVQGLDGICTLYQGYYKFDPPVYPHKKRNHLMVYRFTRLNYQGIPDRCGFRSSKHCMSVVDYTQIAL